MKKIKMKMKNTYNLKSKISYNNILVKADIFRVKEKNKVY